MKPRGKTAGTVVERKVLSMAEQARRNRRVGAQRERDVAEFLAIRGWITVRTAGSLGSCDVVALRAGDTPMLVQVKATEASAFAGFPPGERDRLRRDARIAGAEPWLAWWPWSVEACRWMAESEWPVPQQLGPEYIVEPERGCWIWQRATHHKCGYGMKKVAGRMEQAHRVFYREHVGPIPEGLVLDHLCSVRACVNPDHLEPVTTRENNRRGRATRLTVEQVEHIKASKRSGRQIAHFYGVDPGTVYAIRKEKSWADIEPSAEVDRAA